jgi:hypothetical protein
MKYNEILDEIYRGREAHARECGFDIHKIFQQAREAAEKFKAEGWKVASSTEHETADAPGVLREAPPKKQ